MKLLRNDNNLVLQGTLIYLPSFPKNISNYLEGGTIQNYNNYCRRGGGKNKLLIIYNGKLVKGKHSHSPLTEEEVRII